MSITSEKLKRSTERFMLVRITPARYVGDDLTDAGSGVYTMSFPYPVAKVERNGAALTEDDAAPGVNDHWHHDELSSTLSVKLASAPDEETNVVVVFYHVFLTGDRTRVAPETPTNNATPKRPWLPRLAEYPQLRQSASNNLFGVFTIDSTSIVLKNPDHYFEHFLTDNDSLTGKAVDIWYCLNDVSNITAAYRGNVSGVTSSGGLLTLDIFDQFSLLSNTPLLGDSANEAFFLKNADSFPNIRPDDDGKPIRMVFGAYQGNFIFVEPTWDNGHVAKTIDPGNEAVCTNYNENLSTSVNRSWGLCRVTKLKTVSVGTIISRTILSSITRRLIVSDHNLSLLDTVVFMVDGSPSTERVVLLEDSGSNKVIYTQKMNGVTLTNGTTFSVAVTEIPPVVFLARGNGVYLLYYGVHYSYSVIATQGGNKYISISLATGILAPESCAQDSPSPAPNTCPIDITGRNGFLQKDSSGSPIPIDPEQDKILFRVIAEPITHASACKLLCEGVGLEIDQDTFDQADLDYSANALFSVPMINETEYQNSRHYLEALLNSTMGFLYITPENKVGYKLFKPPAAGDEVDRNDVMIDSMSLSIDFYDVYDQIIARNPHVARLSPYDEALPSESTSSKKAKYLHGISKVKDFDHVLEKIGDRLPLMLAVYSNRKAFYSYQSSMRAIESSLADNVTLKKEAIGAKEDKNLIVTGVTKGSSTIDIEATDLIGVE